MSSDYNDPLSSDQQAGDDHNPYAAPQVTDVAQDVIDTAGLADRLPRLGAAILDGLLLIPFLAVVFAVVFVLAESGAMPFWSGLAADIVFEIAGLIVIAAGHLIINGYLLATRGQTVGKLAVGIRIVDQNTNQILPLWPLFAKRWLGIQVLQMIPLFGGFIGLIDVLMIFRENRRCLHDDIAGTKVIKVKE